MTKFSVKKPLTVFVAVVVIIVLGVVSYMNMTPDLLPNIDMPYIVVVTTYPGATPQKVEETVTKPLEQRMATLDNIQNITSTSSENVSMVVLEFTSEVNMDTIGVDINANISQIQPLWDDMVGVPYILKLNPSMIPVLVTAVSVEGMDTVALSTFIDDTLMNKLEGIEGVASVAANGMIEEQLNVILSQEKIDAVNAKVSAAINKTFDENQSELEDTQAELEDKMPSGSGSLGSLSGSGSGSASAGVSGDELAEKQRQLEAGIQKVEGGLAQLDAQLADFKAQLAVANGEWAPYKTEYEQYIEAVMTAAALGEMAMRPTELSDEEKAQLLLLGIDVSLYDLSNPVSVGQLTGAILSAAQTIKGQADSAVQAATGKTGTEVQEMYKQKMILEGTVTALQKTRDELAATKSMLENAQLEMNIALDAAIMELLQTNFELTAGLASGMGDMLGGMQIEMALTQIESGLEQLETARENALKNADMHTVLTMDTVSSILTAQNFSMPVGYVQQDGVDWMVSVGENIATVQQMQDLILMDLGLDDVEPIRLGDVADIFMVSNADEVYARINGNDGVLLTFSKQSNYATATVSDNVQAKYTELEAEYPGLKFTNMMDQGDYIYIVVDSIMENLIFGALFAVLILFLFLRDIRPTFITLCSIPISVIFALGLMYFSGVTINIISLSGLAVAVGMLVDNSIVVIENTYRLRAAGESAIKAAVSGAGQVAGAVVASTLTNICVFFPIVFVEGITRQLFTDLALTMGYALLASLVVALTLVPSMSSRMLRTINLKETRGFTKMLQGYRRSLQGALNHKALVLLATVALLVASVLLVLVRGFSFMPEMNMPQLTVTMEMPEEATLEETKAAADHVLEYIGTMEEVESYGAMLDSGGGIMGGMLGGSGGSGAQSVSIYVQLHEDKQGGSAAVGQRINERFENEAYTVSAGNSSGMSTAMLGGSGVSINVYGDDLDTLQRTAREVAAVLQGVEGTAAVDDGIGETSPELRFIVDKDKAMEYGLTTAQVYMQLSSLLTTEKSAASLESAEGNYDVIIVSDKEAKLTPDYLRFYTFTVTDRAGDEQTVRLRDIAEIVETETRTSINRENQRRYITVAAEVAEGSNVSLVTSAAERALAEYDLPDGMTLEFTGENETIMESFSELGNMLLLGVLLVYLIMVAQFQSFKGPFIVMFTIPLAFTGGFIALLITGMELSVISLIGFVMLVGIIVNNGIVLVDYINQLRASGVETRQAIIDSGVTRMRPILMTTITTVLGLLMMALAVGTGAELMQPIAIVCIGGLVYATILTLYVVPIMYELLNRKKYEVIDESEFEMSDK